MTHSYGIYTLANDAVYDQLIALLNSIEINVSPEIPICVIPFDDRLDKVMREVNARPNVSLFDDWNSIRRWETFAREVIAAHPQAIASRFSHPRWYNGSLHRKFAAFDGAFDRFVFFDSDSLAMKPLDDIFRRLNDYDVVFDDWEHAKPDPIAALNLSQIEQSGYFKAEDVRKKLHCSSFFGSKRGLFDPATLATLKQRLVDQGEGKWINGNGWWDDAFLFTYMTLVTEYPFFNFTLSSNAQERTGNCANADPFVRVEVLYNTDGLKPIHRLHYMGYSYRAFSRLCQGEDVDIQYKDVFLSYRFLKQQSQQPKRFKKPNLLINIKRLIQKFFKGRSLAQRLGKLLPTGHTHLM